MKILVTGGAGFVGSHYVRTLLTGGYPELAGTQVTVLDKLSYAGNLDSLSPVADVPGYSFVRGDICDAALLAELLPGHDAIVHFAAETHVDRSIRSGAEFAMANLVGTQTLLEAALKAGVGKFVHVSTDEVYGSIDSGSWPETDPLDPSSPYSATKAGSDLLARVYARTHGLDVSITRCCNNYGPYQHPEKVIPLFVTNLMDGYPVPLYGNGLNVREWLHVDDHCRAIQLVLQSGRPGEIYNVPGGTELANKELTKLLLDACGASWDMVEYVPDRKGHDTRYSVDGTKITTELGYRPLIGFEAGLAATVRWYRDNRAWWQPLKESIPTGY